MFSCLAEDIDFIGPVSLVIEIDLPVFPIHVALVLQSE
jgi:hypothetical protein